MFEYCLSIAITFIVASILNASNDALLVSLTIIFVGYLISNKIDHKK